MELKLFLVSQTGQVNESVNFFYMAYMEGFVSVDFEQKFTRNDHWMLKYPKTREFSRLYLLHNRFVRPDTKRPFRYDPIQGKRLI